MCSHSDFHSEREKYSYFFSQIYIMFPLSKTMANGCDKCILLVRIRQILLTLDMIDILCLVHSIVYTKNTI